ncbi:MAG: hypothetical protein LN563_02730 [Rickettsia endosymbiont of Platyusa sonomae]|nr:hypothetical protein [Rickettsia endosymbiont of Platyusa sonomae]
MGELTKTYGDLQNEIKVAEKNYAEELSKQLVQTAIDAAKLQVVNDELLQGVIGELSQLKSEQQERQEKLNKSQEELVGAIEELNKTKKLYGKEEEQTKKLQTQVDKLATDNSKLQDEINVAEEKHKEEFSKQLVQTAIDAAKLQVVNDELLQGVIGELSQLKSEQQGRQEELERKQQELNKSQKELVGAIEELNKTKKLYGKEEEQTKNLQTQVGELTNAQQQFATKLEEAEKNAKNQLETLSAEKDLVYNGLKAKKTVLKVSLINNLRLLLNRLKRTKRMQVG